MKAYKGFNKHKDGTLWCRDMQYEVGKTYIYDGKIKLCKSGFHACHELHQVWWFYPNNGNIVFYEVECGGNVIESNEWDGKIVCSEITLLKEVDMTCAANFDEACEFNEGYAIVVKAGKFNFINTEGKLLTDEWWNYAYTFSEGYAKVENDYKYNFINTEGKLLTETWWDYAYSFNEGYAVVEKDRKYNYINAEGKLLSEEWWDYAYNFKDGYSVVEKCGKYNFINKEVKLLTEEWWDDAFEFNEGYAKVLKDGTWYKINEEGKLTNVKNI